MSEEQRSLQAEPSAAPAERGDATSAVPSQTPIAHLRIVLMAMRPRQWSKNVIVFMALVFSIDDKWQLTEPSTWLDLLGWSVVTFVLLCLISSADYLVNDVIDRESDRQHPTKRNRPIAAGLLSVRAALVWAVILAAVAIGGAFALALR